MARPFRLWTALSLLASLHAITLFAGFFAPYSFGFQDRERSFVPPTKVHFVDDHGAFHFRPFIYASLQSGGETRPDEQFKTRYPIRFFVPGTPYKLARLLTFRTHLFDVDVPARIFLFGTDDYGRDQFSRFLYGGQLSLLTGLLGASFSVLLGSFLGVFAGFYGGWVDEALMRGAELFLACPWLYLLFALRAALPLQLQEWQVFLLVVSVLGLIGWARPARLIRGVTLTAKERNFVLVARGFGSSDWHLLSYHVLPQTYGVALTQMTLLIPQFVLAEVSLSFLGLGVGEPIPSWGTLLSYLQRYYVLVSYWWMLIPAFVVMLVFLTYKAISDELMRHLRVIQI